MEREVREREREKRLSVVFFFSFEALDWIDLGSMWKDLWRESWEEGMENLAARGFGREREGGGGGGGGRRERERETAAMA